MTSRSAQRPPSSEPAEEAAREASIPRPGSAAPDGREFDARTPLERILPELLRRGLEAGRGPLERVSESIFPRDIASQFVTQLGDLRSGMVKAVALEVGRFLREADIASEVRKVLTGLDVEAQVRLRFKERENGSLKPELDIELGGDDKARGGERRKPRS